MSLMLPKMSTLFRRSTVLIVAVVAAALMLTTAGFRAEQMSHPPQQIQSMGETYQCDSSAPLSKAAAASRMTDGHLHLVGWVPMTHAVYAAHRAAPDVYVRFGSRYYPCQVARVALHVPS